jgi:hypothetical protein
MSELEALKNEIGMRAVLLMTFGLMLAGCQEKQYSCKSL